ncbi:MAG: prolyl oligopeptidase family serine peptidase [Cyclobacteriaceae bacterium]|nr:prolyl oligopeptidase family serine peptidase [Cyclobacteriaceae bacterium]
MPTFLLCFLLLIAVAPVNGQSALQQYPNYSESLYKGLPYGLFLPPDYNPAKSYPLVVYLHGSNDLESRDLLWYQTEMQKKYPAVVLTPKCKESNQGWGNTWTAQHTEATSKTLQLVDSLLARYSIDGRRLYLYGISMGGFGVFSILEKEPGKFAAAFSICGGSDARAGAKLVHTPLWIFHGADDDIVPVSLSRNVYQQIVKAGGKRARYTEYAGVKHNSWENALQEKELPQWLFDKRKPE